MQNAKNAEPAFCILHFSLPVSIQALLGFANLPAEYEMNNYQGLENQKEFVRMRDEIQFRVAQCADTWRALSEFELLSKTKPRSSQRPQRFWFYISPTHAICGKTHKRPG